MAEKLILTTPEIRPQITTNDYHIIFIGFWWEKALIMIHLRGSNGELHEFSYGGDEPNISQVERDKALSMMTALNKINLSVKSLQRRVLEQLITDGFIIGFINGSPD